MTTSFKPSVAILLCTKDGARFLDDQLISIRAQEGCHTSLWVSDDGSADDTVDILRRHQSAWGRQRFSIENGPRKGFAANFMSLLCRQSINADYYAFADQDDIWEPDKLARAIAKLQPVDSATPAVYCARTQLIDDDGAVMGYSPHFKRQPVFSNALVQSMASGNTMVMNAAAHDILCTAGPLEVAAHDWWTYSLISGVGGIVLYDQQPSVQYRQHSRNALGSHLGGCALRARITKLFAGRFRGWNELNMRALQQSRELLTTENQSTLDLFSRARSCRLLPRVVGVWRSGVHRQTFLDNVGLAVATMLNKI